MSALGTKTSSPIKPQTYQWFAAFCFCAHRSNGRRWLSLVAGERSSAVVAVAIDLHPDRAGPVLAGRAAMFGDAAEPGVLAPVAGRPPGVDIGIAAFGPDLAGGGGQRAVGVVEVVMRDLLGVSWLDDEKRERCDDR